MKVLLLLLSTASALQLPTPRASSRRAALAGGAALIAGAQLPAFAEELIVLTEEEMAERVRKKREKLLAKQGLVSATDLPLDYNPEAGENLRSKSIQENMRENLLKQQELKKRDKKTKRDDMCEMLGRGC
eukprot:Transcript_20146.p2 GENE.Transcript_20146~~Transcript_20146.p2  ORF type:complete len:130 (+),score=42.97 Transcript_20146:170-559(+)